MLQISHQETEPKAALIQLAGRVMLGAESAGIQDLVEKLLQAGRRNIVVDLAGVTHIDSTGIGRFIDGFNRVQEEGGEFRMAGAHGAVRDAFRVTLLDTVIPFFTTVEEAMQGLP